MQLMHDVLVGLASLLYPPACAVCRTALPSDAAAPLCRRCAAALPANRPPWCATCGYSLAGLGRDVISCLTCRQTPARLTWGRAACRYEGAAKTCVVQLKYRRVLGLAAPMAQRMAAAAVTPPAFPAEALIPVPLHPVRTRERTFNQAAALAHALAPSLGLPVWDQVLIRRRVTKPQASLEAAARRRNVAAAFAVRRPDQVRRRRVLLVDDVLTTGATARACAAALRRAGAAQVGILAFARG